MFKEKLKRHEFITLNSDGDIIEESGNIVYGLVGLEGWYETVYDTLNDKKIRSEIDGADYYFSEAETEIFDSDYHSYSVNHHFDGVYLGYDLGLPNLTKEYYKSSYRTLFLWDLEYLYGQKELYKVIEDILKRNNLIKKGEYIIELGVNGVLNISLNGVTLEQVKEVAFEILFLVRNYEFKIDEKIQDKLGLNLSLKRKN